MKRNYDNWLKAFVDYASIGEAPLSMYFWVGVSTIAGALRRCVWIDMAHFEWVPNFYVILVAPPGVVSKSTTASIGMQLLREVPGINFGPDVASWQALAQLLAESAEDFVMPDGSFMPQSAITIESSEFGTFLNPHDREMIDILVHLWDGKRGVMRKMTKTQGNDEIVNPWVNIIACTTPAWIEGNFPEYLIGGGFTSRCVFVYAEKKRQYVAYTYKAVPTGFAEMRVKLIEDLRQISLLRGAYSISKDAEAWGEAWYKNHYENRPQHLNNERFGGYIARKQTHIHKLAMVLAAAKRDQLLITLEDLQEANAIVTGLEADMPKVFERIGTTQQAKGQAELVSVVRSHGRIETNEAYKQLFRLLSYEDFNAAKTGAIMAGYIEQYADQGKVFLRTKYENQTPN